MYLVGSIGELEGPMEHPRFVEEMTEEERREELSVFMEQRQGMSHEDRALAEHFISSIPGMVSGHNLYCLILCVRVTIIPHCF